MDNNKKIAIKCDNKYQWEIFCKLGRELGWTMPNMPYCSSAPYLVDGGEKKIFVYDFSYDNLAYGNLKNYRVLTIKDYAEIEAYFKNPPEEIKAGDWVVALNDSEGKAYTAGYLYKVRDVNETRIMTVSDNDGYISNGWERKQFRKATPAEVKKHLEDQKIQLGGETVKFYGDFPYNQRGNKRNNIKGITMDKICVKCDDQHVSKMLQEWAFENDLTWFARPGIKEIDPLLFKYLHFDKIHKQITHSISDVYDNALTLSKDYDTIKEFFAIEDYIDYKLPDGTAIKIYKRTVVYENENGSDDIGFSEADLRSVARFIESLKYRHDDNSLPITIEVESIKVGCKTIDINIVKDILIKAGIQ